MRYKKKLILSQICLFYLVLLLLPRPAFCQKVAVVLTKDIPIYTAIFGEFFKTLKSTHGDIEIKKLVLSATTKSALESFSPDLIFTVGTKATFMARKLSGIPKIYTMVVNPIGEGFCTKEGNPFPDMTGILITVSAEKQFTLLKKIMPKVERIGVVYDPSKSSLTVNSGLKVADKMGLILGNIPATDPATVPDKIEGLKGKIEVLWGVVDDTIYNKNSMEFILLFSFRNKIPLIGFSPNQVKAGALFAMYCNYPSLGSQAGEVAGRILDGTGAGDIPLQSPSTVNYSISKRAAKLMGLKIPSSVLKGAQKTFD